ncbi:GNAT family N-acetyltransferase [Desulfosporosinus sp. PR]|uniref:GNAT family N-acetyltransferase n=1 Tax=Candidatus Desulfosporosinus nitrosoreducens TaxID=3401928 RepID=UPI0027E989B0|nr:GNAT family N-acetyltransferase [Desulfosporosinus sp. PR]MDQ7092204.1 GNAT family N-acetyltransferase [Desulfosporosinus sp. PR]
MSDVICLKQLIGEEDFQKLNELKTICTKQENIFLKLELEFKLNISRMQNQESFAYVNEFFYYSGETLVGYLGIFSSGGETGELTGMVHPLYRRKGIFIRLYDLAKEECKRRKMQKVLLVCDRRSSSGLAFIEATGAAYSFSEYEMKLDNKKYVSQKEKNIVLRKAVNSDANEIARQNFICFGDKSGTEIMPEDDAKSNRITYMIETESGVIGKIRVELNADEGFIGGFGILPAYRNKGYGKQALKSAVDLLLNENNAHHVALEVAAHNKNALNLYKSSGFVEESVTDYYEAQ